MSSKEATTYSKYLLLVDMSNRLFRKFHFIINNIKLLLGLSYIIDFRSNLRLR